MPEFVDPRCDPQPPARVVRQPAAHGEDLRQLIELCLGGRIYEIERWIREDRPIQALTYRRPRKTPVASPLRTVIRRARADIVLLLLCNGYRLDLETDDWNSVLDEALKVRAYDVVDLLLQWGADPRKVRPYNVIETYKSELIDRFWKAGLDYTSTTDLVSALAHTANKPLHGWVKRNRADQRLQDALDVALGEAVKDREELPLHLLLWAGADPHRRVPTLNDLGHPDAWDPDRVMSSAEAAILYGRTNLFELLRVGAMPDLAAQFSYAHDSWVLKRLVALGQPQDWNEVILRFIRQIFQTRALSGSWDARYALRFAVQSGGRLTSVSPYEMRYIRKGLVDLREKDDVVWLLQWLKRRSSCDPAIYDEIIRTGPVRQRIIDLNVDARFLRTPKNLDPASKRSVNGRRISKAGTAAG
jgi:hypothetical protein